jgi:hypothetical protein
MDRRGVLAALTPLLAGCFGGGTVSRTGTSGGTASPATGTPASNGTATPESTETATPEPTASADDEAATGHIETARERIETAVDEYAGTGDITDVSADADEFVPGNVYAALVRANSSVSRAGALAATDDQETTVSRLEGVIAFLTHATTTQANVIEGYDSLVAAREALDDEEPDEAETRRDEADTARETADRALADLTSESVAEDMAAVDVIDEDDHQAKREAFDAATDAIDDAGSEISTFADGIELLSTARTRGENGNEDAAVADATDAQERLEDAASAFGTLVDDLPSAAGAFEDLFTSFEDLADEKANDASDVQDEYN